MFFLSDVGQIFGQICCQISWGQKIQCTVLLGRRNTVYSTSGAQKTNNLSFTIRNPKETNNKTLCSVLHATIQQYIKIVYAVFLSLHLFFGKIFGQVFDQGEGKNRR